MKTMIICGRAAMVFAFVEGKYQQSTILLPASWWNRYSTKKGKDEYGSY